VTPAARTVHFLHVDSIDAGESETVGRSFQSVILLIAPLLSLPAMAAPSLDLFFTSRNGNAIPETTSLGVQPGDRVALEMRMTSDERGVSAYSISVDFDSVGEGPLDPVTYANVLPSGLSFPIIAPRGPGDPLGEPGFIKHFTGATFIASPLTENATFTIGLLEFDVTAGILNGPVRIAPGIFFAGVDEILSNELVLVGQDFVFHEVSADFGFGSATLALVPEPGTGLLVSIGLLLLARRRPA
jgi:hypothetical protein